MFDSICSKQCPQACVNETTYLNGWQQQAAILIMQGFINKSTACIEKIYKLPFAT